MQFVTLFSWHPDKAETPAPADLREAEFVKGVIWTSRRLCL
jgi:hypothetical protein